MYAAHRQRKCTISITEQIKSCPKILDVWCHSVGHAITKYITKAENWTGNSKKRLREYS